MRRCLVLLLPLLLAAVSVSPPEVEALLRQGTAAFHRGDLTAAVACFEQAQQRSTDPRVVAFNLATAYYHQAQAGQLAMVPKAELAYRSCLEADDPRRAEALFGLGNCLQLRGSIGKLDQLPLRAAIDRFGECQKEPACDAALRAKARYNQERARLLLLQAPPTTGDAPQQNSGEEKQEADDRPDPLNPRDPRQGMGDRDGNGNPRPGSERGKEQAGDQGKAKQAAGRGALPPVPDRADSPPLAGPDAAIHLDRASKLILDDLLQHRRGRTRAATPGVRDW